MASNRKVIRNMFRNKYGNKAVQSLFREFQIRKYGFEGISALHFYNRPHKPNLKTIRDRKKGK